MNDILSRRLANSLWQIYRGADDSLPWEDGADFPWHDPEFGRRTLDEHLDEAHGAASRSSTERLLQIEWLWNKLGLGTGQHVLDVTCGPGLYAVELARRGCKVTGIDINPAAIAYATELAVSEGVADRCRFIQQDVRQLMPDAIQYDAALFLYEQLAVYSANEAQHLLDQLARMLKPGGRLAIELLDQNQVDKEDTSWWFTDDTGLWGDGPFVHLGERVWNETQQAAIERYHIIHLETGDLKQYTLFDQTYAVETMISMLQRAGFKGVDHFLNWAGVPLYDAKEWVVYIAGK
jgi:ubiquinone/menaquinone biosynthesis C-methylase UbiE